MPSQDGWRIYTDGSKSDSGTGSAFVVYNDSAQIEIKKFSLSSNCSAFQAEMLAIQKATEYIHAVHDLIDTSHIRIITDNQSAITALCNPCSKKSLVIQTRLNIITSPIQIRLEWVKAHHLDAFNNEVDLLAKQVLECESGQMRQFA